MHKKWGFAPLRAPNGSVKNQILGFNPTRMYFGVKMDETYVRTHALAVRMP